MNNNWQAYAVSLRKICLMNSKTGKCSHNKTHQLDWRATDAWKAPSHNKVRPTTKWSNEFEGFNNYFVADAVELPLAVLLYICI